MGKSNRLTVYSFRNVAVVLEGRQVDGLWEGDDCVQVEPRTPVLADHVGADGAGIGSITADESVYIRLRLQATSPAHQRLQQIYRRQRSGDPRSFSVSIRDTGNGEGGNSSQVMIREAPRRDFGANASPREWVLWAQGWTTNPVEYTLT